MIPLITTLRLRAEGPGVRLLTQVAEAAGGQRGRCLRGEARTVDAAPYR
ncbi:hypothetical protein [Saccharomonospora piscinae]|nr:hypothetical protein [Saccharomonospora piscinae]